MNWSNRKILTIVQARTGSSRLPNKTLFPILGKPVLARMTERLGSSKLKGTILIATSKEKSDNVIEEWCRSEQIACFRGSLNDLLDRHYQAAKEFRADIILKIPSDCPLIDPEVVDQVISEFLENENNVDFVSNLHPATHPDGNDVEVMSFSCLERAWNSATKQMEREHTTPYIWENPEKFRIRNVCWETGMDYSKSHRFTLDYYEDYLFIKAVYEALYEKNPCFGLKDILALLEENDDIYRLNSQYAGEYWYRNHLHELRTVR